MWQTELNYPLIILKLNSIVLVIIVCVCATIAQTEAIGKCHLSALHFVDLQVEFVLLDESILSKKVRSSICKLFPKLALVCSTS